MLKAGRGSIVNIGSLASITAMGRHVAYSMAMGAVAQTRELSTEWSARVRVNAILPGRCSTRARAHRRTTEPAQNFSAGPRGGSAAQRIALGISVFSPPILPRGSGP